MSPAQNVGGVKPYRGRSPNTVLRNPGAAEQAAER